MMMLDEGQDLEGYPGIWMRVWVVGRVWREKKGLKKGEGKFGWEGPIYTTWWSVEVRLAEVKSSAHFEHEHRLENWSCDSDFTEEDFHLVLFT
jgi:hypothetical protein